MKRMKYLYGVKNCSCCDSREDCPKELKKSEANLLPDSHIYHGGRDSWETQCKDFYRELREI